MIPEDKAPPIETGTAEIQQQVLSQNQDLMQLLFSNSGKTDRNNINRATTPFTGPCKEQLFHPMPTYFDK